MQFRSKLFTRFAFIILLFFVSVSCTNCSSVFSGLNGQKTLSEGDVLYLVSYNTQTFFDAIQDGREFKEFKGVKSKWNSEKYRARLERLREVGELAVQTMGGGKNRMPDIFVMQEIESSRVIEDFSKLFSGSETYPSVVFFQPSTGESFSTAIFSRFPILAYRQFRLEDSRFNCSGLRPLVMATIEIDTGASHEYLTVFAVHWKSKLGKNTELIRQEQEKQLFTQVEKLLRHNPNAQILICGDFNQTREEFSLLNAYKNMWDYSASTQVQLGVNGSYRYKDTWEAIDHIFFSQSLQDAQGLDIVDFAPIAVQPLLKTNGEINEYKIYSGKGYSDHLPLSCVLEFMGNAN